MSLLSSLLFTENPPLLGFFLNWDSFAPRYRKINLIKCPSFRALNICCDSKIKEELKVIKEIFINSEYPEEVIDDNINLTVTRFKNKNKIFGPSKCLVYFRLLWIGPASQSFAEKVASSVYRCYHAVKVRSIFTTKTAFNSIHKNILPILKQSLLIYKFNCRCISAYISRTCQRLEVWKRQHIPRGILDKGRLTSGQSQAMDSAIGEHLLAINSCQTNNQDDCFSVLHRARDKVQLNILEAIYIALDHPSLFRQRSSHILNILGFIIFSFTATQSFRIILITRFYYFPVFCMNRAGWKGPNNFIFLELFSLSLLTIPLILCLYKFSCTSSLLKYIYNN